jgi:hypothetical protein
MEDKKYSIKEEVENAKRNYIKMFNDLIREELVSEDRIDCLNKMLAIILSFEDEE